MAYPRPHHRRILDTAHEALSENGPQGDAGGVAGNRCTCTGGPYVHGPEGLRLALQAIAATSHHRTRTGEDTDDE
jgi:hypothetical protein